MKYLLDTTKDAVRSRYKGGPESLVESLCLNYIAMRDATGRMQLLPSNVEFRGGGAQAVEEQAKAAVPPSAGT